MMLDEKLQSCVSQELAIRALGNQLAVENDVLRFSALNTITELEQETTLIEEMIHARYEEIEIGTMREHVDPTRPFVVHKKLKQPIWAA